MRSLPLTLLRSLRLFYSRWHRYIHALCLLALVESALHISHFRSVPAAAVLDDVFHTGCREPDVQAPRANATILILARNSDIDEASSSIMSLEEKFNKFFHYPVTFLNDEPWEPAFEERLRSIASGPAEFVVIEKGMWDFPRWMDRDRAKTQMKKQNDSGIMYAGLESYHHMCRFNSGMFYDVPALQKYRWYWRVEPNVRFTCTIPYDPFVEMEKAGKKYGYTVSLWELPETIPSLFRKVSDYKKANRIKTTSLWTAMVNPSWLPWPLRSLMSMKSNRDADGDAFNLCQFWSNFEVADMDFFRSPEYRKFFEYLDADGGFYYERWGDAAVHSFAVALFLEPHELHHFADIGYMHNDFQYCSIAEEDGLVASRQRITEEDLYTNRHKDVGCDCSCDAGLGVIASTCINNFRYVLLPPS